VGNNVSSTRKGDSCSVHCQQKNKITLIIMAMLTHSKKAVDSVE